MAGILQHGHGANYEIDMVHGPMLGKILLFSLPLMLSGVLQLLFNAADIIVVGRFTGPASIAAVGSTTAIVNLMISIFMGLSVGVNVLIAQYYGAGDERNSRETVQTAVVLSLLAGFILAALGFLLAHPVLALMGTPGDVIGLAARYLRIYFLGMPVIMLYNFGSAVLRGVGDTRRPLLYLSIAGAMNVVLNLIFVSVFRLGVAGVALATILSQVVSAALVLRCLMHYEGAIQLTLCTSAEKQAEGILRRFLRTVRELLFVNPRRLAAIFRIGFPAGLQTALFSISNVMIQSSVNTFGSTVMAGNAAAQNLEGFVYLAMNALMQTSVTFISANYGARDRRRVNRALFSCLAVVLVVGLITGEGVYALGRPLLSVYTNDAATIEYGMARMSVICTTYFLCGLMDTSTGGLRGLGYSFLSMLVSFIGSCLLRIVWIMTVFRAEPTQFILYISYPISWALTAAVQLICFLIVQKRAFARFGTGEEAGHRAAISS